MSLKRSFVISIASFAICACATMKPVPSETLVSRGLVGNWISAHGEMGIYCSGAFSIDVQYAETPFALSVNRKTTGGYIAELTDDSFVVGAPIQAFRSTYHVTTWPRKSGNKTTMVVEGQEWEKTSELSCSR